jgi:hypothetical protein
MNFRKVEIRCSGFIAKRWGSGESDYEMDVSLIGANLFDRQGDGFLGAHKNRELLGPSQASVKELPARHREVLSCALRQRAPSTRSGLVGNEVVSLVLF